MRRSLLENKKGQIFTLLAIALIVLMFVSFEVYSYIREKNAIKDRVQSMDSFLQAIEKNLQRQAYISGFRILTLAYVEVSEKQIPINNFQDFVDEAFYNGTVNKVPQEIMYNATADSLVGSVNNKASKINVQIDMENTNITLEHSGPFRIRVNIISDFVMRDNQGLAMWNKTQNISTIIGIDGNFDDPLYAMMTDGGINKVNRTIFEGHYNDSGDLTNLSEHFERNYFAANPNAPSFIGRLRGDLSPDPHGIESFVDTRELGNQYILIYDPSNTKSTIDYIYFDTTNPTLGSTVSGMPSVFRIDDGHRGKYQL